MRIEHEALYEAEEKMEKTLSVLKSEYANIRAGRANPQILNRIMVDYYGVMTPLTQMANIAAPEARLITISLWDVSTLKAVEKAILASDLGLNPTNDGRMIRLVIPELTEERRKDLVKQVLPAELQVGKDLFQADAAGPVFQHFRDGNPR